MRQELQDQAHAAGISQTIQSQYRIPDHTAVLIAQGAPEDTARPRVIGPP